MSINNLNLTELKKYVGVKFIDGSNDVIPCKWITVWTNSVKKCEWPSNVSDVPSLSKSRCDIGNDWSSHKIIPLCHSSTYNKCVERMYSSLQVDESTSQCTSSDIEGSAQMTSGKETPQFTPTVFSSTSDIRSSTKVKSTNAIEARRTKHWHSSDEMSEIEENRNQMQKTIDNLVISNQNLHKKLDFIIRRMEEDRDVSGFPQPADDLEELDSLIKHREFKSSIKAVSGANPNETARLIIRKLMTRNLAMKFSLTGLGDKRKFSKISFKKHQSCSYVVDTIISKHRNLLKKDAFAALQSVFKGAKDWEGYRKLRLKGAVNTSTNDDLPMVVDEEDPIGATEMSTAHENEQSE